VQSEKFVESHGGRIGDIAIYGRESNNTTWRLAKMNLGVRGIDADIRWNNEGSFHRDELKDLRFDYILANPPFNVSDWGGDRLREDARWTYGVSAMDASSPRCVGHEIVRHVAIAAKDHRVRPTRRPEDLRSCRTRWRPSRRRRPCAWLSTWPDRRSGPRSPPREGVRMSTICRLPSSALASLRFCGYWQWSKTNP
jgi:hypothetical protein